MQVTNCMSFAGTSTPKVTGYSGGMSRDQTMSVLPEVEQRQEVHRGKRESMTGPPQSSLKPLLVDPQLLKSLGHLSPQVLMIPCYSTTAPRQL